MIKIRYDACVFSVLFVLNACSILSGDFQEGSTVAPPVYRVMRIETDPLPSFFHSGTLAFITRFPLSTFSHKNNYSEPFLTIVGTPENFSVYKGRPEDGFLEKNKEATYVLRSIYSEQDAKGPILNPFESLFKCSKNSPLCLHVVLSPLYTKEIDLNTSKRLLLEETPLKMEFREI